MWVIRPPSSDDVEELHALAASLGSGMTTFPAHRETIAGKVADSVASFSGSAREQDAQYLLVLEDTESGQVLGVAAVYPRIGHPYGFFSYHRDRLVQHSDSLAAHLDVELLSLSNVYTGLTEVGTLAVHPQLRRSGAGRLLARARYLLMACFPEIFAPRVIAELRGWQDAEGRSPFWSAVGERFFRMDFASADLVSATQGAKFIAELMPKHSLYLDLLPEAARAVVGKAHDTSAIAMAMLIEEGFRFEGYVDVFDAGPQLACDLSSIATVKASRDMAAYEAQTAGACEVLAAVPVLDRFRLVKATADLGDSIGLDSATLRRLGAAPDDMLRVVEA